MKIAIQESALPGETVLQKLQNAQKIGIRGVEFAAEGLHQRIDEILGAREATGVQAAAVDAGATHLLHPDFNQRDKAIVTLRTAMTDALDIGADGVVFIPHYSTSAVLPDLRPYKSAVEMEGELLVALDPLTLAAAGPLKARRRFDREATLPELVGVFRGDPAGGGAR